MNEEISGKYKNWLDILSKGRFCFPRSVISMHQIEDNYLLIYNWDALTATTVPKKWENVEYFDKDGNYLWTVNGMEECKYYECSEDKSFFTELRYDEEVGLWLLFSNRCVEFIIDFATGKVTYYRMSK